MGRWNKEMPDYAQDMITVAIKTEPQPVRQFSQIPILAWGVERVYHRNGDKVLLEQCLGRLEKFHDWFWRERDVNDAGLCCVGSYSGKVQHARWETFRMAEVIATPAWQTPLPVPTVERTDPRWKPRGFWRGDVWPSTNYQIACGFADFGYKKIAADIADKTVANAIENGIYEHYDSATGEGIGIKDYCMSSSIGAMMLDGLASGYPLQLRK